MKHGSFIPNNITDNFSFFLTFRRYVQSIVLTRFVNLFVKSQLKTPLFFPIFMQKQNSHRHNPLYMLRVRNDNILIQYILKKMQRSVRGQIWVERLRSAMSLMCIFDYTVVLLVEVCLPICSVCSRKFRQHV